MSQKSLHVAMVIGPDSELEATALRFNLEYFGATVTALRVGHPRHVLEIFSGQSIPKEARHILLVFHGLKGRLIVPRLGRDVYEPGEPRRNLSPDELTVHAAGLKGRMLVNTACSMGSQTAADVFLRSGASAYVGSRGYVEGNASLLFVTAFYYKLLQHQASLQDAHRIASATDEETARYQLFTPVG